MEAGAEVGMSDREAEKRERSDQGEASSSGRSNRYNSQKRLRAEVSESLGSGGPGSIERAKTRNDAKPANSASSSGNTAATDVQTLCKEVSRLKRQLADEKRRVKELAQKLEQPESSTSRSGKKMARVPSLSTLQDLVLKEKAMNVLKEGITIVDCSLPDYPIMYANEGFTRMTGYSEKETVGRNCRFLQGPKTEKAAIGFLKKAVGECKSCAVELTNYRKNGEVFINYLSLTPIIDGSGKLTHYVGIQSDITELIGRKRAEIEAKDIADKALSATQAKSQFLARMSHEIRTPLNGMIAVGQLLGETKLTHSQRDLVNTMRCSGETLLALITDILDFSRIEANKLSLYVHDFNLQSVVEDAIEIAGLKAAQKRLNVAYSLSPNLPAILRGDSTRIKQVLLNVLYNAIKFTDSGVIYLESSVQVCDTKFSSQSTRESLEGVIPSYSKSDISDSDKLYLVHLSVKDKGLGMTAEGISRLFVSFTQLEEMSTRKYGGTGLGLAISKKLCESMGGEMWAESKGLGQGSAFHFTFKCHARDVSKNIPEGAGKLDMLDTCSTDKSYGKGKVLEGKACLLIEENDLVRDTLTKAIRSWNMKVTALESEESALALLGLSERPYTLKKTSSILLDFVIMDKSCKTLTSALIEDNTSNLGVVFIVWPAADEMNGIGDTSKNLVSPEERDYVTYSQVHVQRPVRQSRLRMALEELTLSNITTSCSIEEKERSSSTPQRDMREELRILIAEDNMINLKVCLNILSRLGLKNVVTAEDGLIALQAVRQAGGLEAFDVIFMDLHMPRMGGREVVRTLRKEYGPDHSTKIVALTADAFTETKELCMAEGFSHWISKPFRVQEIEKILDDCSLSSQEQAT